MDKPIIEPTQKDEVLEQQLNDLFGFDRRATILSNHCVPEPYGCGQVVTAESFRDATSLKEYSISGLCQQCQDSIFGRRCSSD